MSKFNMGDKVVIKGKHGCGDSLNSLRDVLDNCEYRFVENYKNNGYAVITDYDSMDDEYEIDCYWFKEEDLEPYDSRKHFVINIPEPKLVTLVEEFSEDIDKDLSKAAKGYVFDVVLNDDYKFTGVCKQYGEKCIFVTDGGLVLVELNDIKTMRPERGVTR